MKGRVAKATSIPKHIKDNVGDRDDWMCVICHRPGLPEAHIVSRAQLGKGIESNLVTLCRRCHRLYDSTKRKEYGAIIRDYIKQYYPEWTEEGQKYKKWT